jgi:hypothetical protein
MGTPQVYKHMTHTPGLSETSSCRKPTPPSLYFTLGVYSTCMSRVVRHKWQ